MQWGQLWSVVRKKPFPFLLWLMANLGGLIVAYIASITIWFFHGYLGNYIPGPEVYLITGTVSLAVAGFSYVSLPRDLSVSISAALSLSWPLPLAAVYGILITMGVKEPVVSTSQVWLVAIAMATACWLWSSVIWLHEQGIRMDMEQEPTPPEGPPKVLEEATTDLPKIDIEPPAPGEGPPHGRD